MREILKATALTPKRIVLYAAPAWKRDAYAALAGIAATQALEMGGAMKALMADAALRARGGEVQALAKRAVPELARLPPEEAKARAEPFDELAFLKGARAFLSDELHARVDVVDAEAPDAYDPKGRARAAAPWRPAIYVE